MKPEIGPEEMRIINCEAKQFKRNRVFLGYSSEDIAQDMALFVWKHAEKYDPARGQWLGVNRVSGRPGRSNTLYFRSGGFDLVGRNQQFHDLLAFSAPISLNVKTEKPETIVDMGDFGLFHGKRELQRVGQEMMYPVPHNLRVPLGSVRHDHEVVGIADMYVGNL